MWYTVTSKCLLLIGEYQHQKYLHIDTEVYASTWVAQWPACPVLCNLLPDSIKFYIRLMRGLRIIMPCMEIISMHWDVLLRIVL